MDSKDIESQAWNGAIKLAGSILVLSIAFKNIGLDFSPVMQALTIRISQSIEHKGFNELNERLIEVEKLAHKQKEPKNEE